MNDGEEGGLLVAGPSPLKLQAIVLDPVDVGLQVLSVGLVGGEVIARRRAQALVFHCQPLLRPARLCVWLQVPRRSRQALRCALPAVLLRDSRLCQAPHLQAVLATEVNDTVGAQRHAQFSAPTRGTRGCRQTVQTAVPGRPGKRLRPRARPLGEHRLRIVPGRQSRHREFGASGQGNRTGIAPQSQATRPSVQRRACGCQRGFAASRRPGTVACLLRQGGPADTSARTCQLGIADVRGA